MRDGIFLVTILLLACTPATRAVAPTAELPTRAPTAAGLSTTPVPDGGPSPAEAATYTAVAILVQATPTPTGTPRPGVAPQVPATTGPTAPADIAAAQIGQVVRAPNWEFKVVGAQRAKEFNWLERSNLKATAKGEFVMVTLDATNIGNQNFGLNSFDFELYDGQNRKYAPDSLSEAGVAYREWLRLQGRQPLCIQCPPSVVVPTGVLFDVAPGLTGLKLRIVQARTDVTLP